MLLFIYLHQIIFYAGSYKFQLRLCFTCVSFSSIITTDGWSPNHSRYWSYIRKNNVNFLNGSNKKVFACLNWFFTSQSTHFLKHARTDDSIIDFSLTIKAATLIFISGCGSAISSAKEGKPCSIYNLVKNKYVVWAAQTCVHFMKIRTVYSLTSHLLTLKAHNHKMYVFVVY